MAVDVIKLLVIIINIKRELVYLLFKFDYQILC